MLKCPRCKMQVLNPTDCGESSLYRSNHLICEPCFFAEEDEIEEMGTNDLPNTLAAYGGGNIF